MDPTPTPQRKLYLLWFFAAALSLVAVGIEYYKVATVDSIALLMGGFCIAMGFLNLRRTRAAAVAGVADRPR